MKSVVRVAAAACVLLLAACGTLQKPVPLSIASLTSRPAKVGVVLSTVPKPDTQFPGAGCLLCLAAANIANQSLTYYANTLPSDDLATLPEEIAERLRAKGVDAKAIADRIQLTTLPGTRGPGANAASKDFSALGTKYGVDKLVVIEIAVLGFTRSYSSYVPTADPKAMVYGVGYLVDLRSNAYEWYQPIRVVKGAEGVWDEPPKFPGLTNAYFQALETSKDELVQPFAAP